MFATEGYLVGVVRLEGLAFVEWSTVCLLAFLYLRLYCLFTFFVVALY